MHKAPRPHRADDDATPEASEVLPTPPHSVSRDTVTSAGPDPVGGSSQPSAPDEPVAPTEPPTAGTSEDGAATEVRDAGRDAGDDADNVVPDEGDEGEDPAAPRGPRPSWAAMGRAFLRPSKGQLAVGLLCFSLGLAAMIQVRAQQGSQAYAGQRREDLVAMVDSLNKEHQRLQNEQSHLENTKSDLQSGADKQKVARDEAKKRIGEMGILAGTSGAVGPGARLVISDPQHKVTPAMLLDAIEELRDSGAEAIEINDSIRVVASTAFVPGGDGILADGKQVTFPLQIDAIGNPATLEGGARFRGGIISQVQAPTVGGTALITQLDKVEISATLPLKNHTYAKPAK